MLAASKIWRDQANISLERVGPINDVVVPVDLGDPLFNDACNKVVAIAQASMTNQFWQANLYIYGTWNLEYRSNKNVGGSTTYNMCFVENQWSGRPGALVCAHELGHALGLAHSGTEGRIDLLMQGSAINNDFLDMLDIEWTNRLPWPASVAPWLYGAGVLYYTPCGLYGAGAPSVGENRSEPKGLLKSNLFAGDARLELCAASNPGHVAPGAGGPHVRKVQAAVMVLDGAAIAQGELDSARYGPSTARAVLAYKTKRHIVNRAYETQADDIVGIMTIKALDAELLTHQVDEKPTVTRRCPRVCNFRSKGDKTRIGEALASAAARTAGQTFRSGAKVSFPTSIA